jgi:cytochrome c553
MLSEISERLEAGYTLPAGWYSDSAILALERERIFKRTWQYACVTAELQEPGQYFATKKPRPGSARDKALAELGQKIYRGGNSKTGLPACSSCHLPTGAGLPAQYPRLAGQYADYTYAQLQGFAKGDRGSEIKTPDGKSLEDTRGRIMAGVATKMSDREMRAVAEYVSGLR